MNAPYESSGTVMKTPAAKSHTASTVHPAAKVARPVDAKNFQNRIPSEVVVMPTNGHAIRVTNQPNTLAIPNRSEVFSMLCSLTSLSLSSYPD